MLRTLAIAVVLVGAGGVRGGLVSEITMYGCFDPETPSTEWVMPADNRSLQVTQTQLPNGDWWTYHNHPWIYPSAQRVSFSSIGKDTGSRELYSTYYVGPNVSCQFGWTGYRITSSVWSQTDVVDPPLSAWPSPAKFSGYLDDTVDAADAGYMFRWWNTFVADLTGDDITDAADVGVLFAQWNGDASPVPEPTTPAWLILAALCSRNPSRR